MKDLEALRPSSILDIIYSGEAMAQMVKVDIKRPVQTVCRKCGQMSSQELCQACMLLETLNKGLASIDLSKPKKQVAESVMVAPQSTKEVIADS